MKTSLIVTLGARDLQLDKSFKDDSNLKEICVDTYPVNNNNLEALKYPREHGNMINANFEFFEKYLKFPIVIPAINYVLEGHQSIDKLILVVTNQQDEKFKSKDTFLFGKVLNKYLEKNYKKEIKAINGITFKENISNFDFCYNELACSLNQMFRGNYNWRIFLLPQGGIDSINTTLLLRCIENFSCFSQLAKLEGQDEVTVQKFPNSFRSMLNKHRLIQSIENFNYTAIDDTLTDNHYVLTLSKYAYYRLGLDYEKAWKVINDCNIDYTEPAKNKLLNEIRKDVALKDGAYDIIKMQSDMYAFVKIRMKQEYYADFLMRLFALSENILIPIIEENFKVSIKFNIKNDHKEWKNFIKSNPKLEEYLKEETIYDRKLDYSYPGRNCYISIYCYLVGNNYIDAGNYIEESTLRAMNILADLRNKIAHGLTSISKELIDRELANQNYTVEQLFDDLDKYFGFDSNNCFGIYSEINKEIINNVS